MGRVFVPEDFTPPEGLHTDAFVLEPLGAQHNERDHAAWMSSIAHIHASPGFDDDPTNDDRWPVPMTLAENLADLHGHADDFRDRRGFTYTVLDPGNDDVIGCVYIYPEQERELAAVVRSWVRVSHADRDEALRAAVRTWLGDDWPFASVRYQG
jgi:hypothetical protein